MERMMGGSFEVGRAGESEAVRYLEALGFKIIERNFKTRFGEIDLIAEDKGWLCFIEVKASRGMEDFPPKQNVTPRKQRRIIRCAQYFLKRFRKERNCRFDVLSISRLGTEHPKIEHVRNAFWLE